MDAAGLIGISAREPEDFVALDGDQHHIPRPMTQDPEASDLPKDAPVDACSDEQLMAAILSGNGVAYQTLVTRHALRYRALAFRFLNDLEQAEDCVQDVFIAVWQKPDRFNPDKARFTTWFHRVVVNKALDMKRRKTPDRLPEDYDAADDRDNAEDEMVDRQTWQGIGAAIDQLPDRQAQAIRLTYFDGLANQAAADVMEIKVKAFESLLVRARTALKSALKGKLQDQGF